MIELIFVVWAWTANPKSSSHHTTKSTIELHHTTPHHTKAATPPDTNWNGWRKVKGYYWLAVAYCADVSLSLSLCVYVWSFVSHGWCINIVLFSFPCVWWQLSISKRCVFHTSLTHLLNHLMQHECMSVCSCALFCLTTKPIHYCNSTLLLSWMKFSQYRIKVMMTLCRRRHCRRRCLILLNPFWLIHKMMFWCISMFFVRNIRNAVIIVVMIVIIICNIFKIPWQIWNALLEWLIVRGDFQGNICFQLISVWPPNNECSSYLTATAAITIIKWYSPTY